METDSFETDLRQALAHRAADVPGEAVERLQRRPYLPRTSGGVKLASAGLAGVAVAAAGLGIAMSQPASPRASAPVKIHGSAPAKTQLAAWSVTTQADGTVVVSIRDLTNPAALQAKLRAAGIPASVTSTGNPACTQYPASATNGATALQLHAGETEKVTQFFLRSSALPHGAGLQIVVLPGNDVFGRLVKVSKQCTGS